MYEEDDYPRGGSKRPLAKIYSHSEDKQENLFGLNKQRKSAKKKQLNKSKPGHTRDGFVFHLSSAEALSFKTVQEGMLVLGCVKDISSLSLTVELPGLMFCKLQINCISEAFTHQLSERLETNAIDEDMELHTLNKVFKRGQLIPTRVIQVEFMDSETKVLLSTKPKDVNANFRHSDFRNGLLSWGAVTEKSDHGYILDVGVRHVRSILPFKNVQDGKEYVIGEPLWCIVKSGLSSNQATTLTLSALQEDVDGSIQKGVSHMEKILPGMCVNFWPEKSLKDGLEGTIYSDTVAYVNQVNLLEPLASWGKYVGESLPALVLYVQPTTGFTFLTLRTTRMVQSPNLSVGQILHAQVISRTQKGIFVKLGKKERGFVTRQRLRNSLNSSGTSDSEALIEAKYPEGSTHQCRILDYALMDGLYICTFEKHVLDEKVFAVSDLTVGEVVRGTVQETNRSGVVLKIGNVTAFVTNEHLSNTRYNEVFKGKFKKGQTVTGRVWLNRGSANVKVTLKSSFVESDVRLRDYGDAQVGTWYPGMVIKITGGGALVKFYNDVQGWLKQPPGAPHSFKQMLYEGQVLSCVLVIDCNESAKISARVVDKEGTKLTLSLEDPVSRGKVIDYKEENVRCEESNATNSEDDDRQESTAEEADGEPITTSEDDAEEEKNQINNRQESDDREENRDYGDDEDGGGVDSENEEEEGLDVDEQVKENGSSRVDFDGDDEEDNKRDALNDEVEDEEKEMFDDENENDNVEMAEEEIRGTNGIKTKELKRKQGEEIEYTGRHFLMPGNEDSDSPDFEEANRLKIKAACTKALVSLKLVNTKKKKKKKEEMTQKDLRRIKRRKTLLKTLKKIEDKEAILYDESYKCNTASFRAMLPGVQHFFESDREDDVAESSSEDEEASLDESAFKRGKKRKLSRREQADLLREQEDYLCNKEEELVNLAGIPQNAEQFDRRLLGEPNSSELWAQYVAFHIQSTEIDKARAVIQRALKTIQQSAVQDRLNIWITYLNLEGMYGTKETFDEVFEEAVRCNDALTVYLEAIKILADSSSTNGLDEKIKKARGKFKQEAKMYLEVGKVYYKLGKLADARKLKDGALRTIVDRKKHVPLIVQFAIMEFNDGEDNYAEALFETILQSDPRRSDVWGAYVDQLVKKNKIDLARRVLQRAVGQKLKYKKMKVLYKKFQEFEQRHGTDETQEQVRQSLQEYASQFADA